MFNNTNSTVAGYQRQNQGFTSTLVNYATSVNSYNAQYIQQKTGVNVNLKLNLNNIAAIPILQVGDAFKIPSLDVTGLTMTLKDVS